MGLTDCTLEAVMLWGRSEKGGRETVFLCILGNRWLFERSFDDDPMVKRRLYAPLQTCSRFVSHQAP